MKTSLVQKKSKKMSVTIKSRETILQDYLDQYISQCSQKKVDVLLPVRKTIEDAIASKYPIF